MDAVLPLARRRTTPQSREIDGRDPAVLPDPFEQFEQPDPSRVERFEPALVADDLDLPIADPHDHWIDEIDRIDRIDRIGSAMEALPASLELRVLSGLHAGAALALEDVLVVGRSAECDVLLLDDGVADRHLQVEHGPEGELSVVPLAPGLLGKDGRMLAGHSPVRVDEAFCVAGVWMMVCIAASPWTPWPPAPGVGSTGEAASAVRDAETSTMPMRAEEERRQAVRTRRVVMIAGAFCTLFGLVGMITQLGLAPMGDAAASASSSAPLPPVTPPLTPPTQAPATITSVPAGSLRVVLPNGDAAVLPFDIREVVLGNERRVTLQDGRQLSPGDAAGEWRLVDVKPGILVFDGPQRVQVPW